MRYVDLTQLIEPNMPVFPGTEQPKFEYPVSIEKDGFLETKLHMYSHTGTHMDGPAHLIKGKPYLNDMDINKYCGDAVIINVEEGVNTINLQHVKEYEKEISKSDFVIIKTGWSKFWGTEKYFGDFPVLDIEATEWLVSKDLKGIGLDTISIDPVNSTKMPNHMIVLGKELIIIENLTNLGNIESKCCKFFCFPLKFKDSDGSPIRAVAAV